jgi:putative ABC transport system ATP-binding protein
MPRPIIQAKNLDITYNLGKENEYKATKNADLEIFPGEYVAFFGPSGCGKSTIFYSILGILQPSAGELYVDGENPYTFSSDKMVEFQTKTIGIIYQAFFLINSISVLDNVALPQTFLGISPAKRTAWAKKLLVRFGLEGQMDKFPTDLSGGQMQRVSVARAMVNMPKIVLADEPTGNLDSVSTKHVMDILAEINSKEKRTIVLITHNAAQLSYCHRVFYMKDGKVSRIVPNPEKTQIAKIDKQKSMVTEMDQLSKIYPYSSPVELKVKSMINYLTQDINIEQVVRMENIIKLVVERKISADEFCKKISQDYKAGGVGISRQLSSVMAEKVFNILEHSEDVSRYRRRFEQNMFFSKEDSLVNKLTKYVLEVSAEQMSPKRLRILKESVRERISGVLRKEEFYDKLMEEEEVGGLHLSKKSAKEIVDYYEKIIIQGMSSEGRE